MTSPPRSGHAVPTTPGFFGEALTKAESDDTADELAALTARIRRPQPPANAGVPTAPPSHGTSGGDVPVNRGGLTSGLDGRAAASSLPTNDSARAEDLATTNDDVGVASVASSARAQPNAARRHGAPRRPIIELSADRLAQTGESMREHQVTEAKVPVVLQLPASLTVACKEWSRLNRITYADLVLAAVDAHHKDVPNLLHLAIPKNESLFVRRPVRASRHTEALAQFTAQMLPSEVSVLDDLVVRYGAPSRAQLVGACLRELLRLERAKATIEVVKEVRIDR